MATKVKNFTTTLSADVAVWLDGVAKETHQPKKDIIENALRLWKRERTQKKIALSYRDASKDSEWVELGNMGLREWSDNIEKWEK